MPVTSAAKKAHKRSLKNRAINSQYKKNMKVTVRIFEKKIEKGEKVSNDDLSLVYKAIDKAHKKNLLHWRTAARRKRKLALMYNKATA